jgi:hypothetical protein
MDIPNEIPKMDIPNDIPPLSQKGFWDEPMNRRYPAWDPGQGARESPKTPWQLRVL